jgi:uncharacterized protein (TIGR03067 family)
MRRRTWLILALGVVLSGALGCGSSGVPSIDNVHSQADLARSPLQGEWLAKSAAMEGSKLESEDVKTIRVTFHKDQVTIRVRDELHQGTFETGTGKGQPLMQINITPARDNKLDRPLAGIYQLVGDGTLLLCLSEKERPTMFNSQAKRDWILLHLRRP